MRFTKVAMILALLVAIAIPAFAQETTGSIRGRVVDAQGLAVPGVTVTATGTQGAKTTTTDTEGRFTVPFLTPGAYTIKAELQGFKTAENKDVNIGVGQAVDLTFKLDVGGLTETVQVAGTARVVDTTSTTIGSTLSSDMLAQIPVGRRVADTLYLAPGVSSSGTAGRMNPSISGGTGLENNYVVDGANVTNMGFGGLGSYSLTYGSLGNSTPFDFVKEIQVKTGGYEAEFGQATGGVVNVITKSGSNLFRGSAFGYSQPAKTQSSFTQYQATNGSVNTEATHQADFGAEGGGPIVKDHVFFFGAIDPQWTTSTFLAPPNFPLAVLGNVDRNRRTTAYALKGTLQLGSGHRIDTSFFGDPSHGATGPQRTSSLLTTPTASSQTPGFSTLSYGGHQQTVRYDGVINSHFLLEASFARSTNSIAEVPSVDQWRVTDTTVIPNVIIGGIGSYEQGNRSLSRQYSVKATNIFGGHQLKYGVLYDDAQYLSVNQRTGPTFVAADGRTTATGASVSILPDVFYGKIYRVTRANFNINIPTFGKYPTFFVQDSWKVGSRLTINPGLRYEQEKLEGQIVTDFELKNNWAPRIGATFDATGDGRTKVYGNYGRYYARIPQDLAARALSADDSFSRGDYFDAGLTKPIPAGTVTQVPGATATTTHFILVGAGADTIDPNAKLSYDNEFVFGVEREVMVGTTFGIRYIYRNTARVLEDVANCPMAAYERPATVAACGSVDYILTNPSSATPVNAAAIAADPSFAAVKFDDPVHKYNALEVTLTHRGSNWSTTSSYRYSRLRGNFEGFYRDDNGQSDPGISSLYDFPTNDPTYVKQYGTASGDIRFLGDPNGILPLDRPHQLKLIGNYTFPMGLNVGANLNLTSGRPLTPMYANPQYSSQGEIPGAARGSGIQTVDGFMTRSPFESQLDMQAAWAIKMSGSRRLTLMANVFNVLNEQKITYYDQDVQLNAGAVNPDYGKPVNSLLSGTPPQYQAPRNIQFGVRIEF